MKHLIIFILAFLSIGTMRAQYDFVVAKDGSGNYTSVQAAIDACKAFPDKPIVVFIKKGVYSEKVIINECNASLTLLGEDRDSTIIVYNDFFDKINRGRNSTFYTGTLIVNADDFRAENLTIENSAGKVGQAVALHITGNRSAIRNCRILGNQDTLYASGENSYQLYDLCYIEGTVDFIFGSATAFFNQCTINSKANAYITAPSTQLGKTYGFVFFQCKLTADEGVDAVFLGRPWRDYAKSVYIQCELGKHIRPEGWSNWENTPRDKTAYFAEFQNSGPGAPIQSRVTWSHQLTQKEAKFYTMAEVLKGGKGNSVKKDWYLK